MIYGRVIFKVVHVVFLFRTFIVRVSFFCFAFPSIILTSFIVLTIVLTDCCVRFFVGKQFD